MVRLYNDPGSPNTSSRRRGRVNASGNSFTSSPNDTLRCPWLRVKLNSEESRNIPGFSPTPGMPAEVYIKTTERTFFQYIVRPIHDSMMRAFRER